MNKIKVLLVEDEQSLAMILSDTLEAQGFEMRTAGDGEEGLRMFEKLKTWCLGGGRDDAQDGGLRDGSPYQKDR